ncbi:kinesin-like protein KIN-14B isoform X1 [Zingiber officinale]|uniref:kinesin-like protein KIN-14B isoform X1 n=2 Tax=Zingiber officinale TaxID=94328 RepID=UPI001C4AD5D5|nr:kinesin-like protein KIN-14B isoform X1 [Zingiber officinale]
MRREIKLSFLIFLGTDWVLVDITTNCQLLSSFCTKMDGAVDKDSSDAFQSLPDSIHSLRRFNSKLTDYWFESVCCIIKELQESKSNGDDMEFTKIQAELDSLRSQLKEIAIQRRQTLNDFLDLKGNIRVFCRVRPLLPEESCRISPPSLLTPDSTRLLLRVGDRRSKQYNFDKVFHPQSTQEEVFSEIEPVIKSALDGYNVCIFAYGQTGTGKTYSMEGSRSNPGIVIRGIQALFQQALESNHTFQFNFSMLEIYMGGLRDLLVPRSSKQRKPPALSIQMNSNGGVEIENLVSVEVHNFEQVKTLYNLGKRSRSTGATKSNLNSSRSHCLICISIACAGAPERRKGVNKIWMIDLGGSERLLKTQATGRRLEEGKAINLSLSALGDVISALQHKKSHVPYRNSKLTQVLRDSLGFDSKTLMFVHVSPKEEDLCETICSLGFAARAGSIHLDSKESPEMQARKEVEMTKLEQKIRELEIEQKDVQREIKKLKEKQNSLLRLDQLRDLDITDSPPLSEELRFDEAIILRNERISTQASPKIPRFMKSTICSQKRINSVPLPYLSIRKKPTIPSKARRTTSLYAESVHSEANDTVLMSECDSKITMSTSYPDEAQDPDDDIVCSQDTSDYEIKQVIFTDKEKFPLSTTSLPHGCLNEEGINAKESNEKLHSSIEDWLHQQIIGQTITPTACGKRVLVIPIEQSNDTGSQQNAVNELNQEDSQSFGNTNSGTNSEKNSNGVYFFKSISVDEASSASKDRDRIYCQDKDEYSDSFSHEDFLKAQLQENKEKSSLHFRESRRSVFVTHPSLLIQQNMHQHKEQGLGWRILKTLRTLWMIGLVLLGIRSLGLGLDFFHGLML